MDRIQLRRDTSANWASINPILLEGEPGYETDTKLRKIGDGVSAWNDLPYLKAEGITQELGNNENLVISQDLFTKLHNEGYKFAGIANLDTIPQNVTADSKIYYIANTPGTYANFNNLTVGDGEIAFFTYNGSWSKVALEDVASRSYVDEKVDELESNFGTYISDKEYIRAYVDSEGKFLWGIKYDGSVEWVNGIPSPIKKYLDENFINKTNPLLRKRISIIGDSISTFDENGYKIDGYAMWYPSEDVTNVTDTWWYQFIERTNSNLEVNTSYSGSTSSSNLIGFGDRVSLLGNPNLIFVAIGTNDYNTGVEIGEIDFDAEYLDLTKFAPSYIDGMRKISNTYPTATVVCLSFGMSHKYADTIKTIATHFNAAYIDVRNYSGKSHPTKYQMKRVCDNIIDNILFNNILETKNAAPDNELLRNIPFKYSNIPEWDFIISNLENQILFGIKKDGSVEFSKGIPTPINDEFNKHKSYLNVKEDYDIEKRSEITLDAEGYVVSYRDSQGKKFEPNIHIENSISLGKNALSELEQQLIADGFNAETPVDWSSKTTIELPIPRYCAKVNIITESGLAISKTDNKKCKLEYWDKSGNYFKKYIILNAQGSSSMSYHEKNQSIDIYNDENYDESCDIIFGNWVAQDSFHLKCYYIDVYRGMANFCYNYVEEIIQYKKCRSNRIILNNSNTTIYNGVGDLSSDFGDGALCHPDGFPFELYVNGAYYGLFAWNLKKHRKNYSMDKNDATKTILDGIINGATLFGGVIDWTQFELRNPKDLTTMDGKEYDADFNCNELIDETSPLYDSSIKSHINSKTIKEVVKRLSQAIPLIKNTSDTITARQLFEEYFDKDMMMVYLVIGNVLDNWDGFNKNWIWTIYNGIAAPNFYDMDSCFGRYFKGNFVWKNGHINSSLANNDTLPTGQLIRLYETEIQQLYSELRNNGLISVDKIMSHINSWLKRVGIDALKRNIDKWNPPSYRDSYLNSEYWKITGDYEGTINYDSNKSYNIGDKCFYGKTSGVEFECIKNCINQPPLTQFHDEYPYEVGMFDTPKRIELWLKERINFLDNLYKYTENE